MKYILSLTLLVLCSSGIFAQHALTVKILNKESQNPLQGATAHIKKLSKTLIADSNGIVDFENLPQGRFSIVLSYIGFDNIEMSVSVPQKFDSVIVVSLALSEEAEEEVVVQSTRTSRTIANVPTRVETIELEEIDEKSNMRPANVAMILHESTGIQVQQTSATSGNASIRLQGLDGKYTQLLKDGYANFGNFSSGLSVLEIPPLDLKQVEIIKGPASPLYGGGAIAGVVNFISRTPGASPEYNFIINHSNIGQSNIGGFVTGRGKKIGYTFLGLLNKQKAYDVDDDQFTEVPQGHEYTFHPKIFLYPDEKTMLTIGNSFTRGNRTGGDIHAVKGQPDANHVYFEKNTTQRNTTSIEIQRKLSENKTFVVKQSVGTFDRSISLPDYIFAGKDINIFTDVSFVANQDKSAWVLGGNYLSNKFNEASIHNRDNKTATAGLFAQHTWDASGMFKLESGIRIDAVSYANELYKDKEVFVLPRMSLLVKYNEKLSSRLGAGMGYKTPTLFTEETETIQYRDVAQLDGGRSEKSLGGTADVNYRTKLGSELSLSLNHMFFYTRIGRPLVLVKSSSGFMFVNSDKSLYNSGFETNAKFIFKENFKLFLGYTFNNLKKSNARTEAMLYRVPRGKLNSALIYEREGVIKLGLEGYFTGRQYLADGSLTPRYEELGFMAEKIFKQFSLYINFENFTDTRQSRYKKVVNGTPAAPIFDEIWTHTEGFIFNGGIKLKF